MPSNEERDKPELLRYEESSEFQSLVEELLRDYFPANLEGLKARLREVLKNDTEQVRAIKLEGIRQALCRNLSNLSNEISQLKL